MWRVARSRLHVCGAPTMPECSWDRGKLACTAVLAVIVIVHLYARDSWLLLHDDEPCQPTVLIITCEAAPSERRANVQAIKSASPWPVEIMLCETASVPRDHPASLHGKRSAQLFAAHTKALTTALLKTESHEKGHARRGESGGHGGCFLVLEDDAVVDWPTVQRAVRATNWLREPWDLVSLYDRPLYDEGWGRYYYTDRLLRFGCLHRILAGKANSAAILFSRAGASRVVGYSSSTAWRPGGWDLWLGELNGEPLSRLADAIPSTGRQWLRVLRWGCTPAAVQHGSFTSTLDAERAAYRPAGARDAGSSPSANRSRSAPSARRHHG